MLNIKHFRTTVDGQTQRPGLVGIFEAKNKQQSYTVKLIYYRQAEFKESAPISL